MPRGGQGNKGRKPGSGNPGYGPGSGRGWSGSGIGGSVGFGRGNTPSTKNNSGQGGNNNFSSKGHFDAGKFVSGLFGGDKAYADQVGQLTGKAVLKDPKDIHPNIVKRMEGFNLDVLNPQPGLTWNIDTQRAINNLDLGFLNDQQNENVKGFLNKHLPQSVKDLRINHQMYYTPKIKVGDPRYTPQGTGSGLKIDKDTANYIDWIARKNPSGMTVSDAEKIYANAIRGGATLEQAMRSNPAETGSYYALLADQEPTPTPEPAPEPEPKPTMDLNKIYNELLGRDVGQEGRDYWGGMFDSGQMSIQNIRDSIKQSTEYKGNLQPPTVQPSPIQMTGQNTPTFQGATVTRAGGGGSNTPTLNMAAPPQAAPSWNIPSVSIAAFGGEKAEQAAQAAAAEDFYGKTAAAELTANLAEPTYRGALPTAYTRGHPAYVSDDEGWEDVKDSKHARSFENLYHQNILDELTKHAQQSEVGNFAVSDASKPQWMPAAGHDNRSSEHYRNQASRTTEDLWQQGQISDLEAWVQTAADKYGVSFSPSEVYSVLGKDGKESRHTNEGYRRNLAQSKGIESIVDAISQIDAARAPELKAEKDRLSGIYGNEVDRLYNELYETDTGMSQEGKDYWVTDLIENRPGLEKGSDWREWLGKAFRATHDFKDYEVSKGAPLLDIEGAPDNDPGTLPSVAPTFQQDLEKEKERWGIGNYDSVQITPTGQPTSDPWADAMQEFTSSYTSQINDLKKAFQESTRSNERMLKSYQDQVAGYQKDLQAQAAYGERPTNQTVKGVKTRNELPGYKPKTGGSTGHFNRTGSRLSTQSLNVA